MCQASYVMTTSYLTKPIRTEYEVRLDQLHYHLDRAALAAKAIADILDNHLLGDDTLQTALDEWRVVQSWLSDPEDALWHDHIRPAQELLKEVYGD